MNTVPSNEVGLNRDTSPQPAREHDIEMVDAYLTPEQQEVFDLIAEAVESGKRTTATLQFARARHERA